MLTTALVLSVLANVGMAIAIVVVWGHSLEEEERAHDAKNKLAEQIALTKANATLYGEQVGILKKEFERLNKEIADWAKNYGDAVGRCEEADTRYVNMLDQRDCIQKSYASIYDKYIRAEADKITLQKTYDTLLWQRNDLAAEKDTLISQRVIMSETVETLTKQLEMANRESRSRWDQLEELKRDIRTAVGCDC